MLHDGLLDGFTSRAMEKMAVFLKYPILSHMGGGAAIGGGIGASIPQDKDDSHRLRNTLIGAATGAAAAGGAKAELNKRRYKWLRQLGAKTEDTLAASGRKRDRILKYLADKKQPLTFKARVLNKDEGWDGWKKIRKYDRLSRAATDRAHREANNIFDRVRSAGVRVSRRESGIL